MSYANFIPTVWSAKIETELDRLCVFAEDCNREYEGTISKMGESVKILGVGRPTIHRISKADRKKDIADVEVVEDESSIMYINQMATFNYMVDDIDKRQASGDLLGVLEAETSEALACEVDEYIARFATDSSVKSLYGEAPLKVVAKETEKVGEVYVLDVLDKAIRILRENDVKSTTKIVVTMSPRFFELFQRAYLKHDTNNHEELKNGKVAMYRNVIVKESNSVYTTNDGAVDNIMIRTRRAIAFANPMTHTEPYRPEKKFGDAIKGFMLFDAKVVRPKEIVNINVKYA